MKLLKKKKKTKEKMLYKKSKTYIKIKENNNFLT